MNFKKEIKDMENQIKERKDNNKNLGLTILLLLSLSGVALFSNLISSLYLVVMCLVCITLFMMVKKQNKKEMDTYNQVLAKIKKIK